MLKSSSFWALLLGCGAVVWAGTLTHPTATLASGSQPTFVAQSQPGDANTLFTEVAQKYAADNVPHLSVSLWQQRGNDGQFTFEVDGRLTFEPEERARLEMSVVYPCAGKVTCVSDGINVRQRREIGGEAKEENWPLPKKDEQDAASKRMQMLQDKGLIGPSDLLRRLQPRLKNLRQQAGTWNGKAVVRVSGDWAVQDNIPADSRPPLLPRTFVLFLDAKTHWPIRIEWWGSKRPGDEQALILEMEYREPKIRGTELKAEYSNGLRSTIGGS